MMQRHILRPDSFMPSEPALASLDAFLAEHKQLIEYLYLEANCSRWELPGGVFAEALRRSAEKRFHGGVAAHSEIETYLKSLQIADLALACACAAGSETAWEFFVAEYRIGLRGSARVILRASGSGNDTRAAELADSLHAELYGLRSDSGGRRKSLFEYFHGRSKLSTWLYTLLAQRHVDLLRSNEKLIPLEDEREEEAHRWTTQLGNFAHPDPDREMYLSRLGKALSESLAGLSARERMVLACYYSDQKTLAEIGRMLKEHESTVSRQLDRTRRALRENVTAILRSGAAAQDGHAGEPGFDDAQIERAFAYAVEDWPFDLSRALSGEASGVDPPQK